MKQKVETLQADLSRRQESYIRRERAFNMRIDELEEEVASLKARTALPTHNRGKHTCILRLPKCCAYEDPIFTSFVYHTGRCAYIP